MRWQSNKTIKKIKAALTLGFYVLAFLISILGYGIFWRMEMPSNEKIVNVLKRNGYEDVRVGRLLFRSACHHKDLYAFEFTGYLGSRFIEGTLCWKRSDIEIIHKPTTIFNQ